MIDGDIGLALIKAGVEVIRTEINEKLYIVDVNKLNDVVKNKLGVQLMAMDKLFALVSDDVLLTDERFDISNWKQYHADLWDCDNYAFMFKTWMAFVFGYTGVAVALGKVVTEKGNEYLHAWNYCFTWTKDRKIKIYLYEPQLGVSVEVIGKKTTLKYMDKDLTYIPILLIIF